MDEEALRDLGVSTHAGFPNAAIGSQSRQLDLSRLLIAHPSATYLMRLDSNEWKELGMFSGDIVVIDRAVEPTKNDVVVWWDHDQFVMSNLATDAPKKELWGTVTSVIHRMKQL